MADNSDSEEKRFSHQNQHYDEALDVPDADEVASIYTPTPRVQKRFGGSGPSQASRGNTPPKANMSDNSEDEFDTGQPAEKGYNHASAARSVLPPAAENFDDESSEGEDDDDDEDNADVRGPMVMPSVDEKIEEEEEEDDDSEGDYVPNQEGEEEEEEDDADDSEESEGEEEEQEIPKPPQPQQPKTTMPKLSAMQSPSHYSAKQTIAVPPIKLPTQASQLPDIGNPSGRMEKQPKAGPGEKKEKLAGGAMEQPPPPQPKRGPPADLAGGNAMYNDDEDEETGSSEDDDDDDEGSGGAVEGAYDPADYEHLPVTPEIKELFQYITRYTTQTIDLEHKLKPFIPDFIPAVGDIDAFLKIQRPDGKPDTLGLTVLDEPCARQSDPTVLDLQLRAVSKQTNLKAVVVKSIDDAEKNPKAIDNWVQSISEIHRSRPPPNVHYTKNMPDIDSLMQEWPADFEELLKEVSLPNADLDCDLASYVDMICAVLDIPIYKSKIQSLHVLFTLYSEFKNSQHFRSLAAENKIDNSLKNAEFGNADTLII